MNKKKLLGIISIFFIFCFIVFLKSLNTPNIYVPSATVGKKIPLFETKKLFSNEKVNSSELFNKDKFYLVNIWSSWCAPCRKEHPILMELSKNALIEIIGLNYKDDSFKAKKFIKDFGNPYSEIITDLDGIISIELGAYGVPETLIIDQNKLIFKKYVGPLDNQSLKEINTLLK